MTPLPPAEAAKLLGDPRLADTLHQLAASFRAEGDEALAAQCIGLAALAEETADLLSAIGKETTNG